MNKVTVIAWHPGYEPHYGYWTKLPKTRVSHRLLGWLNEHATKRIAVGIDTIYFEHEQDAIMFKLGFKE